MSEASTLHSQLAERIKEFRREISDQKKKKTGKEIAQDDTESIKRFTSTL